MTPEFGLIANYFSRPVKRALLGAGDDCALLPAPTHERATAISTDTLVAGVHFFADVGAASLGHKALAVNLSDLAAMGATPRYFTLALTLPTIDHVWLDEFSSGLYAIADAHEIELVGGDTTRGPLSISITVIGDVAPLAALRRDRARVGDDIWVSGSLGGAALALDMIRHKQSNIPQSLLDLLERPTPRVGLGHALLGFANAAIDLSDGLVADLGHITERSNLSASILWEQVPLHAALRAEAVAAQQRFGLAGGDDYELCFTADPQQRERIAAISQTLGLPLTRIGTMSAGEPAVVVQNASGEPLKLAAAGFDHFSNFAESSNEA